MEKQDLVPVVLYTHLNASYVFPDVSKERLELVLPKLQNRIPEGHGQLQLVNASLAILSVPFRILKSVVVDGETWWESPDEYKP